MSKPQFIYVLNDYVNKAHRKGSRSQTTDETYVEYSKGGPTIILTETNSLIEDEYSLHLLSSYYTVEGTTERKESMIHHHEKGHPLKHLQFKLASKGEKIRIFIDPLDREDYENCIKGFLSITRDLLTYEQMQLGIQEDLPEYFFNEHIDALTAERSFLLEKIKRAYSAGQIQNTANKPIGDADLIEFKKDPQLKLFLDW